jgi:hypothetical protein
MDRPPSVPPVSRGADPYERGATSQLDASGQVASGNGAVGYVRLLDLSWRLLDRLQSERVCWSVLGGGMALSASLGLWLTRGATFYWDELMWVVANRGFDPRTLLGPHNGNLIAGTRLIYAAVLKIFGADYVVFRLLEVSGIALVAGLFFVLAKRRIGPAAALLPSLLLLFLGSAYEVTLLPLGIQHVYCVAAGLGALLALERAGWRADLAACALLLISVATFSTGLAFLAGIAVSVLLRDDRWRRAWIFVVPLVLYVAWYVAAPRISGPEFSADTGLHLSNVLLLPNYIAAAAASVSAALTGLSYDFSGPPTQGGLADSSLGAPIALLAVAALIFRIRRGRIPASLYVSIAILLAYWIASGLVTAPPGRLPNSGRYLYSAAVAVLLVATDAGRGLRISRGILLTLMSVTALALGANLALLRVGGHSDRSYSATIRTQLAALEVARGHVDRGYVPTCTPALPVSCALLALGAAGQAGQLLAATSQYGSFGFSPSELQRQSEALRGLADSTVAGALRLRLTAAGPPTAPHRCLKLRGGGTSSRTVTLRPPGILMRSAAAGLVILGRFAATPTVNVGALVPGHFLALQIPADRAPQPWHAAVATAGTLTLCPLS